MRNWDCGTCSVTCLESLRGILSHISKVIYVTSKTKQNETKPNTYTQKDNNKDKNVQ